MLCGCVSEALQLVMTAAGHSNEARRKIVSGVLAHSDCCEISKFCLFVRKLCLQCFDAVGWAAGRASGL